MAHPVPLHSISRPDFDGWIQEVTSGTLDELKLRKFWPSVGEYWPADSVTATFFAETECLVVICDGCHQPTFSHNTKAAYSNAYSICNECIVNFSWCQECKSYILTNDLGNPTHRHLKASKKSALFAQDEEVDVWNADIMTGSERTFYLKTTEEMGIWKHAKEAHKEVLHPAHTDAKFRYFGIELEVEKLAPAPPDIITRTRQLLGKYAMIKHDGSLSNKGKGGFEIVSVPATLAYHKSGVWNEFFGLLGYYFVPSPPTTGLHVHVGLETIGKITAGKMLVFVNSLQNREFIESIAERKLGVPSPSNGKVYASVNEKWTISHLLSLKQHLPDCVWNPGNKRFYNRYSLDTAGRIKKDTKGNPIIASIKPSSVSIRPACRCPEGKYNLQKYEALRLATQRPTIEMRIFRGNVNQEFLYSALEFVDALADFCADVSPKQLTYSDFLTWVCKYNQSGQSKLYPNLSRLLINKAWIDPKKEKLKPEIKLLPVA